MDTSGLQKLFRENISGFPEYQQKLQSGVMVKNVKPITGPKKYITLILEIIKI